MHWFERKAVDAVSAAIETHNNMLGLTESSESAWQLIASLLDYCAANDIDFDATVKDIRENYHFSD